MILRANNANTSFSEIMGLPDSQIDQVYWLPWYNNKDLDTRLQIANVSNAAASVQISIGGAPVDGSPFALAAGASTQLAFAGLDKGPVEIRSNQNIVASERVIYNVNGVDTSFSEIMALPNRQLDTIYWLPWYNNKDLDTQLRFANVSASPATVHVTIGGAPVPGSPFTLGPGVSIRKSFPGMDKGPVKIESDVDIVASERVIYRVDNVPTSFSEMMALPDSQLNGAYWLPWYNNKSLDTQLRVANADSSPATVRVYIGGQEMAGSPFTIPVGASIRKSFNRIDRGPVQIVSQQNILVSERVIFNVGGVAASFSEIMGLPASHLDTIFWLPRYNNVELNTQLRFGAP
jgi:hypothetical protein